jgi:nucleoside-diphosphate-sugar epimerase
MSEQATHHLDGLSVAVTGASGNVGTALLRRLTAPGSGAAQLRALARRHPPDVPPYRDVQWHLTDLGQDSSELGVARFLDGVDAVVHLAWALQPGRRPEELHRVNVGGTRRVIRAAATAGVAQFVHMSSIGAYTPGSVGVRVAEDWPTTGVPSSQYSRDKSEAERVARVVAGRHPDMTLTVVRPTFILQPAAASQIGRYFLGPLVYSALRMLPGAARRLPLPLPNLALSFLHTDDVADALTRMLDRRAPGPFNLAAEPLLGSDALAEALVGSRRIRVPVLPLRAAMQAAFAAHVIPTEPGWLDMGTRLPALDSQRARRLLDWTPAHRSDEVLAQFVAALVRGDGAPGPLLRPAGGAALDPVGDPANSPGPRSG